jgi:putative endonuclease
MSGLYHVYLMTNRHKSVLYTGVTSNLEQRVFQHQTGSIKGFTSRYHVDCLVYYEETDDVGAAIAREKQIKGWSRAKKVALIESVNPGWLNLSAGWFSCELATHVDVPAPAAAPPDSFAKLCLPGAHESSRSE